MLAGIDVEALVEEAGHERQVVADQLDLVGVVQKARVFHNASP